MKLGPKLEILLSLHNKAAVARAAGITADGLRLIRTGKVDPSRKTLIGLAMALGLDVGWLADDGRDFPAVRTHDYRPDPIAA
jgi:transcriptional regulator with XRE-family HTH domain